MQLARFLELIHRSAHRQWARRAGDAGLTYSEFEYLSAIRDQEARQTSKGDHGQHLQDVVDDMGVRKASASAMVVKLEARGWVHRVPCRYDARAQHILLTEEGAVQLAKGREIYTEAARELLGRLEGEEQQAVANLLEHLEPGT
ncbi:MarR family winged helix-turn-helix transcriptional regulator [Cribrihabitans neustonicus]|uniref:MarR family winged helix-turn-helix transcriptional regulator n=1 Tax=Cribrihabitans neustonicus TaxID=1429085 RepID=UPI003B5934A6